MIVGAVHMLGVGLYALAHTGTACSWKVACFSPPDRSLHNGVGQLHSLLGALNIISIRACLIKSCAGQGHCLSRVQSCLPGPRSTILVTLRRWMRSLSACCAQRVAGSSRDLAAPPHGPHARLSHPLTNGLAQSTLHDLEPQAWVHGEHRLRYGSQKPELT